jgi:hypothetical protein
MGYYENIRESNRQHAAERATMHPLKRKLHDIFWNCVIWSLTIVLWLILLSPLWLWVVR